MCGIFAVFGYDPSQAAAFRHRAIALSKRIRHRGPDWSGYITAGNNILCHERLAIVGIDSGAQPLVNDSGNVILCVNGEIYNHKSLRRHLKKEHVFKTHSDCEIILYLYEEMGPDFVGLLDGMFSFVLYDKEKDIYVAARDHVGITTLYQGFRSSDNSVWFSSEMKSLNEDCDKIIAFPPGHVYTSSTKEWKQYYNPKWYKDPEQGLPALEDEEKTLTPEEEKNMYRSVRRALERAVKKRLMCEVPYGVLLSGGLDSSLIASIAQRQARRMQDMLKRGQSVAFGYGGESEVEDNEDEKVAMELASNWPHLHSFSIGLPGSPDLAAAQKVAKFLGTVHHEFTFTLQEGLDAIAEVIHHLETYDVTTVRASTPMYLLSRKIKAMGVKMVLSGEGSDEIFAGYLYFHQAPSAQALHHECISRIQNLHTSDCLRANKATMAWGLEARVPFLDKSFLDTAMECVPANHKLSKKGPYNHYLEKYVLRQAFEVEEGEEPYLPKEILWRQKEQFSDGVGYSWIDGLKDFAEKFITDEQLASASQRWERDTPTTKEAYWYRDIFEQHFPQPACLESVVRWIPRKDWGCNEDPSGRAQKVHNAAYEEPATSETVPIKKRPLQDVVVDRAGIEVDGVDNVALAPAVEEPESKKAKSA